MFSVASAVRSCSQYRVPWSAREDGLQAEVKKKEGAGSWNVERVVVVMVAEAVSAGWNKVTLVDRCMVVCLLAPTVV